jgi:uncharacterized protein (DUF1330 family)
MAKGYWVATYRSISDPEALARYGQRAPQVIQAHGGRILARGSPARVYEAAKSQRAVIVEFESVAAAVAAYESDAYSQVRRILDGAVEREIQILEGI